MTPSEIRQRMADAALGKPYFLADTLAAYTRAERLTSVALAARLGGTLESLDLLAVCRRPDPASDTFKSDVERIATACGVDRSALVQLLRHVEVSEVFRTATPAGAATYTLAARDRDPPEEPS